MNSRYDLIILGIICLLMIRCKTDDSIKEANTVNQFYDNFEIINQVRDSVFQNKKYHNVLKFKSFKDSIANAEGISNSKVTNNVFLFLYTFEPFEDIPDKIADYNEDDSSIFIPQNDSIFYDYSFKRKGWNKKVLILLDQVYLYNQKGKIRRIEKYAIKIDSVYVK
ncbi:hypothetical protein [Nonlabens sp.]|uniref:hypothetical protein n=1 Tax=Nonlabens sp. TaxID=1888209 RepID=UPI003F695DD9